jgi:DNA ligase (NAD+)
MELAGELPALLNEPMIDPIRKLVASLFGEPPGNGKLFHPSQACPECGSKLCAETGSPEQVWHCPNPDCPAQVRRGLVHWCSPEAMDIAGGDAALVAKLVERGLARDVAELYRIKVAELAALPGMDKDSAQKFFDALTASMKRDTWRVLFGLGIPNLGAAEAQLLCQHFASLDALFATGRERLMKLPGVTEIMARSLTHWSGDPVNRKLLRRLEKAGVNFKN